MHKGSWGPPQWVGCNYGKWKISHIMVSHIHPGSHSSAPTTDFHKILHPTPKEDPQAGLLPSCSSNSTSSMEQRLGLLGSTLKQMKMSPVEQTEAPWVYQEQTYSSMLQDEKLTSWSSGAAPLIKSLDWFFRVEDSRSGDGSSSFLFKRKSKSTPDFRSPM